MNFSLMLYKQDRIYLNDSAWCWETKGFKCIEFLVEFATERKTYLGITQNMYKLQKYMKLTASYEYLKKRFFNLKNMPVSKLLS